MILNNPSLELCRKEMKYLLTAKQYSKVLSYFSVFFKNFNYELRSFDFYIAEIAFKELYPQDDVNQFFSRHYTKEMDLGEKISDLLTCEDFVDNFDKSLTLFKNLLDLLFREEDIKLIYKDSFVSLINCLINKKEVDFEIPSNNNYILVSGTGWSGSGAVVDYLKEFDNIFFSGWEWSIFEDHYCGFKKLIIDRDNLDNLWKDAIKFFLCLLGCQKLSVHWWMHKALFGAYNRAHSSIGKKKYAELMGLMGKALGNIVAGSLLGNKELCTNSLHSVGKILLCLFSADISDNSKIIIDNAVHVYRASILRYLDNVKMIAVIRDPRSNYVSLKRECISYVQNTPDQAKTFVCSYIKKMRKIDTEIRSLAKQCGVDRIKFINFEDFVLHEDVRHLVLNFLHLDLKDWNSPQKYFKIDESLENVFNFNNYENLSDIQLIANFAEDYLYKFNG